MGYERDMSFHPINIHAMLHPHYKHPILHHANIVGILFLNNIPYKFHHGNIH